MGRVDVVLVCEAPDLPRLGDALASVLAQGPVVSEVLLCPVDVTDEALRGALAVPPGLRLRRLASRPTWAEAANDGAHGARGELLLFLRGCDLLSSGALSAAAASLASSGSDLATGVLLQSGSPEPWLALAQREAHESPGAGVVPAEQAALAGDLAVGNKLVRRRAWRAAGARFGEDDSWLLSPAVATVLASAERVDVLDAPVVTHAFDHGMRAFSATPSSLPGLDAWRCRVGAVSAAYAGSALGRAWRQRVAAVELPRLLSDAERADADQWAILHAAAAAVRDEVGPAPRGSGPAARALVWLAAEDRATDAARLAADVAALGDDLPTEVRHGRVQVAWPSPVEGLPGDVLDLDGAGTPLRAVARRTRWGAEGRDVDLVLEVRHVDLGPQAEIAVDRDGVPLVVAPLPHDDATRWAARRFQRGAGARVGVPGDDPATLEVPLGRGAQGRPRPLHLPGRPAAPAGASVVVTDLHLDSGVLVVHARGLPDDLAGLHLLDPRDRRVPGRATPGREPGTVRVELRAERFGVPTWLGPGPHRLVGEHGNVAVADPLRGRLPLAPDEEPRGPRHRVRAHLGPRGGLVLGLGAPLADDEVGPWAQQRLREAYERSDAPVDPDLFYFETYTGRTATDSPLAILQELRRRRPGLRALWGISDHSQRAPEGTTPVLLRSREWYDALATAGVLVLNTDVEAWFRRRPGQFLLQTFHGYPSKAMGRSQWRALDHAPSRVAGFRARGVDSWSAILTPTPQMTRHYREQYDYDGPALERGYPRDDDLVGPGAEARRLATRRLLGIADDQVAVLYAPTWREHLATRPRAAAMTDHLDVAAAARALGERYVLLLRGHRFHTPDLPDEEAPAGGRVVDVTAYPEVNDLLLASDAAVLDYSSLRFDYALTDRPMVFLVPDLAEYDAGSRSFLFPFADTAPGPFVAGTDEVVAQLRDLPSLRERYAVPRAAFNAEYNAWHDGHAAERVVDGLLALLAERPTAPPGAAGR